jgi:hypothetical protein
VSSKRIGRSDFHAEGVFISQGDTRFGGLTFPLFGPSTGGCQAPRAISTDAPLIATFAVLLTMFRLTQRRVGLWISLLNHIQLPPVAARQRNSAGDTCRFARVPSRPDKADFGQRSCDNPSDQARRAAPHVGGKAPEAHAQRPAPWQPTAIFSLD